VDGPGRKRTWLLLAAVLPGLFMNSFDFFAVNVATRRCAATSAAGRPPSTSSWAATA
jgi:hypothetical protein